jgi:predicted DNA-binding protein
VNRRFSVRLSDELAQGIDALARRSGKTKSEVVRDALTSAGLGNSQSTTSLAEALRRAATLRARQTKVFDVVALVREGREGLDRRGSRLRKPPRKDPACMGRREPPGGRVTPGFQR